MSFSENRFNHQFERRAADARRLLPAIRRLFDAAIDAEKWPVFLKELAAAFAAKGSHIVRVQPHEKTLSFSALYGFDDAILKVYGDGTTDLNTAMARFERHFVELMPSDPRVRFLERFPYRPLSCRLEISESELHRSKVYQDQLRFADAEYSLLASLAEDDGSLIMFGVFRGKQSRHFDQAEVDVFGELIPHLKQAIGLSEHLTRLNFLNQAAFDTLDSLAMGLLLVADGGRLVHANAAGRRIVELADGINAQDDILRLHDPDDDTRLRELVRTALVAARKNAIPPSQAMTVTRPSGREPIPLLVASLARHQSERRFGPLDRPLALLFASLPEEPQEAPVELLRRLFGLTLAEARVCERLVRRRGVKDIALELDITVETVRVHLKNAFAKTGTSKQTELVAKIMATPVWMHYQHRAAASKKLDPRLGTPRRDHR